MPSPFVRAMVEVLRASDRYRLSAIVEMANLTPEVQERLTGYYADRCWPLLQQAQFSNLRTAGPWLFGSRPARMSRPSMIFNGNLNRVQRAQYAAG